MTEPITPTVATNADPLPAGPIRTPAPWGRTEIAWERITRWHQEVRAASREFSVPASRIYAHIAIESQGDPAAVQRNGQGTSYGLMQVAPRWWRPDVARLAGRRFRSDEECGRALLHDPLLAVRAGCYVLRTFHDQYDSWDAASSAFFTGTPDWDGRDRVNGTTGAGYKRALDSLIAEIEGAGTSPLPPPQPPRPVGDVIATIMGGVLYSDDYGFKAPTDLPYYGYFVGHGGRSDQHTGIDVTGQVGQLLYSPIHGTVVCAGTDNGEGAYGSSCAAYTYTLGEATSSSGRFEILADNGTRSLILGHVLRSLVPVGTHVSPGQAVAELGGMNGPHVHVESRLWRNGDYTIVDPRQAFGDVLLSAIYASPVPYERGPDQPSKIVVVTADSVPVRQRADPAAPETQAPLAAGDEFAANAQVVGVDGAWWWLTTRNNRVPVRGTALKEE